MTLPLCLVWHGGEITDVCVSLPKDRLLFLSDLLTNQYLQHFLGSPSTVAMFVVLCLLAVVIALGAGRRRVLVLATGVAAAAIGGLTLAPARGWTTLTLLPQPLEAVRLALRPALDDLGAWAVADGPANVALFVPFTLFTGLLLRRPTMAFMISVTLTVLIESYQAATGTRVGAFADIVSNSVGALIGAVGSALLLTLVGALSPRSVDASPSARARTSAAKSTSQPPLPPALPPAGRMMTTGDRRSGS